jgi:hypothetical protein
MEASASFTRSHNIYERTPALSKQRVAFLKKLSETWMASDDFGFKAFWRQTHNSQILASCVRHD